MQLAKKHKIEIIERPEYLCTHEALGEDAFKHGYEIIKESNKNENIEYMVLLFCNAVTFLAEHIDKGINILKMDESFDSAVTVSKYNWYSPVRARKIDKDGSLKPFIPFENYPEDIDINCDRNTQGDVFFADMSHSVSRSRALDDLDNGLLPQRWMGKKILPIYNSYGCDIDLPWQVSASEWWLKDKGFSSQYTPYEK